ncbi:MAG: ribonuclease HII [Actinobacteria bacterium]|nr:ribonuclease HII [Actinomycetota bacterium]
MKTKTFQYESKLRSAGFNRIAGVDEAGRGALAGPLVVAAVILDVEHPITGLNDSKLLTKKQRDQLRVKIYENALAVSIVEISEIEIDEIGIGQADVRGMRRALARLANQPDFVISDGFAVDGLDCPSLAMKKGDQLCASVAAASIIAKTYRDDLMVELDRNYPQYGLATHKGYGTSQHLKALREYGNSEIHRRTFIWDKSSRLEVG